MFTILLFLSVFLQHYTLTLNESKSKTFNLSAFLIFMLYLVINVVFHEKSKFKKRSDDFQLPIYCVLSIKTCSKSVLKYK